MTWHRTAAGSSPEMALHAQSLSEESNRTSDPCGGRLPSLPVKRLSAGRTLRPIRKGGGWKPPHWQPGWPPPHSQKLQWLLAALIATCFTFAARAELPTARLHTIFPPGGQTGAMVDVAISGSDLDHASRLLFSHDGITAKQQFTSANEPEPNRFVVSVATNVPPGTYEARVIGRFGVSSPRFFAVGMQREANDSDGNSAFASAQSIALETTVNGRAPSVGADFFRFEANQGQRVLIECVAKRIDSRMEPVLVLFDSRGKELDRDRQTALLDFTAPASGSYVLKLHDLLYRGGEEFFYRLTVSSAPRIDFIFPPAGLRGTKSAFTLYGRNLPGGEPVPSVAIGRKPLEKLTVDLDLPGDDAGAGLDSCPFLRPADAVLDGFDYRLSTPAGLSNPTLLTFATAPVLTEIEPNDKPAQAQKITLPGEVAGQFHPQNDADWFQFDAKKGEVYWIEIFSQRLGLPTDPFALVQRVTKDEKGEEKINDIQELYDSETNIGGAEFNTATRDPQWRFEVKEDGTYRVQVRDLFNRGQPNPALVYRLSIRKESPDFRLVALAPAPPPVEKDKREARVWSPLLRRGSSLPIKVLAFRRDNFGGDIDLSIEGLPSGVSASAARIAAGQNVGTILLSANDSAADWSGPIRVIGRAKGGEQEMTRDARAGLVTWNVGDYNNEAIPSRLARELFVGVAAEPSPFLVLPAENKVWETSLGAKLQVPLQLVRRGEFKDSVKLRATGPGLADPLKEWDVDGKATNAVLELDLAKVKVPAGEHQIHIYAQTKGKIRRLRPEEIAAAQAAAKSTEEVRQQAEKSVNAAKDAAKKASEALTNATQAFEAVEKLAAAAAEKLAATKTAADKAPVEESAATARIGAEKELAEIQTKVKAAAESKATAEQAVEEANSKVQAAEQEKDAAAAEAKSAAAKLEPRDVNATFYSSSLALKVASAPITLVTPGTSLSVTPGGKVEIPLSIQRLHGFNDSVEVTLKESAGLKTAKLTFPKDQSAGKLVVETAPDAKSGERRLTLEAALKFNGQDLKLEKTTTIQVVAASKE